MNDEVIERLWGVFQPETVRQVLRVRERGTRFVHYTTAESGMKILRSKRMLMRNSTLLNDFSELQHGMDCLVHAYQSPAGEKLKTLMQAVQPDLPKSFEDNFNGMFSGTRGETYLISVSEHGDLDHGDEFEDAFGRLSMWRAYANCNGVAFVFNNTPFVTESDALRAYTCPVIYATPEMFTVHFSEVVDSIEKNIDLIATIGGHYLLTNLLETFLFAAQSTKHPAFREEREWRVLYTPTRWHTNEEIWPTQLERVPTEVMTLRGVPQRVYAIPFQNHPDDGFVGATIPELFDRVLIGPSPDAYAISQAFVAELASCGVPNAHEKVIITNIPLRT